MRLTVWKMVSHRASESKVDKVAKQERRDRKELARKIEELGKELEAAKKSIARGGAAVRGNGQDRKRGTA